jgi:hypothetical protein
MLGFPLIVSVAVPNNIKVAVPLTVAFAPIVTGPLKKYVPFKVPFKDAAPL